MIPVLLIILNFVSTNVKDIPCEIQIFGQKTKRMSSSTLSETKIWILFVFTYTFAIMPYKKLKSVRLAEEIVNLVKDRKKETYMPIGIFFELAAKEKLEREKITTKK